MDEKRGSTINHKKFPDKFNASRNTPCARRVCTTTVNGNELRANSRLRMPKHCDWSETERGMALGLCASGRFPLREITNIINIPKSTVYDIKERGVRVSKPRSRCPRKLSSQDMRQIIRYIQTSKQTRRVTIRDIRSA